MVGFWACFIFIVWLALGIGSILLCMLIRYSTTELYPSPKDILKVERTEITNVLDGRDSREKKSPNDGATVLLVQEWSSHEPR